MDDRFPMTAEGSTRLPPLDLVTLLTSSLQLAVGPSNRSGKDRTSPSTALTVWAGGGTTWASGCPGSPAFLVTDHVASPQKFFQSSLPALPIRHDGVQQAMPFLSMIWVEGMGKFVANDVVNQQRAGPNQIDI